MLTMPDVDDDGHVVEFRCPCRGAHTWRTTVRNAERVTAAAQFALGVSTGTLVRLGIEAVEEAAPGVDWTADVPDAVVGKVVAHALATDQLGVARGARG